MAEDMDGASSMWPLAAAAACGALALAYSKKKEQGNAQGGAGAGGEPAAGGDSQRMMYTWSQQQTAWPSTRLDVPHELGAVAWSASEPFKLLVGSAEDDPRNAVSVVERGRDGELVTVATAEHRYRPSKVMFLPGNERVFATASDTVYLWDQAQCAAGAGGRTTLRSPYESAERFEDFSLPPLALPPQWPTGKYCAPIVGFDVVGTRLVAAHCDGQSMIWDLNLGASGGRVVTLDHTQDFGTEVYDVVWAPEASMCKGQFAVCGSGGVHIYDASSKGCAPSFAALVRPFVHHVLLSRFAQAVHDAARVGAPGYVPQDRVEPGGGPPDRRGL